MAAADKTQPQKATSSLLSQHISRGLREAALFLLLALAAFLMLALVTYSPQDPGWSYSTQVDEIRNAAGVTGAFFADVALSLFGYLAYLFPVMLAYAAWQAFRGRRAQAGESVHWGIAGLRFGGFVMTMVAGCALATLHFQAVPDTVPYSSGGILGDTAGHVLLQAFNFLGATLLGLAVFLAGVTLFTGLSWLGLMDATGKLVLAAGSRISGKLRDLHDYWAGQRARKARNQARLKHEKKLAKR